MHIDPALQAMIDQSVQVAPNAASQRTGSSSVATATPAVFNDLCSGLRVESGDSLDLLSTDDSILTSGTDVGAKLDIHERQERGMKSKKKKNREIKTERRETKRKKEKKQKEREDRKKEK